MSYVVKRSGFHTAVMLILLCAITALGVYGLAIFQPADTPNQRVWGVVALAAGGIGLVLLWRRLQRPAEELVIDGLGLHWRKVPRPIGWAEMVEIRLDAAKSDVYLYIKLRAHAHIGDMEMAHPIEILGSALSGSDLTIRLSGTDCKFTELDEAMLRFKPPEVIMKSPLH